MVTVSPDDSSGSGNALTNGSGDASGDHHHHKANGVDQTDHQHHHENEKRLSAATATHFTALRSPGHPFLVTNASPFPFQGQRSHAP